MINQRCLLQCQGLLRGPREGECGEVGAGKLMQHSSKMLSCRESVRGVRSPRGLREGSLDSLTLAARARHDINFTPVHMHMVSRLGSRSPRLATVLKSQPGDFDILHLGASSKSRESGPVFSSQLATVIFASKYFTVYNYAACMCAFLF